MVKYNLKTRTPAANTVLAKVVVQCSPDTFVVKITIFAKSKNVVQKARCARLLYNALRLQPQFHKVRHSYNCGFAKFRKNPSLRFILFCNFAKLQRVTGKPKIRDTSPRFSKIQRATFLPSPRRYIVFCTNEFAAKISIRFFNYAEVRAVWDEQNSKWWFSVLDIVGVLNEEPDYTKVRNYWKYLKAKLKKENTQLVSATTQLKLLAADNKKYNTDMLDSEGVVELAKHFPNNRAMKF